MFAEFKFPRPTDCVAFCPVRGFQDLLAVGSYELIPSLDDRRGSISLMRIQSEHMSLKFEGVVELAGVLDLQWAPKDDRRILASASADGRLRIFDMDSCKESLFSESTSCIDESMVSVQDITNGIVLSIDWANDHQIYTSTTDGYISLVECAPHEMIMDSKFQAHDLEVWCVTSDSENVRDTFAKHLVCFQSDIVFSGSDDCTFKGWDLRADTKLIFCRNKEHDAGVCTIAVNPQNASILATGSYDENLRIWDRRMMSNPVLVQKVSNSLLLI
eukprot:g2296.t1